MRLLLLLTTLRLIENLLLTGCEAVRLQITRLLLVLIRSFGQFFVFLYYSFAMTKAHSKAETILLLSLLVELLDDICTLV